MRAIGTVLLILLFLAAIGVAFFALSWDPRQLQINFQQALSQKLAADIHLGEIVLSWEDGPALRSKSFSYRNSEDPELFLEAKKFLAKISLRKSIQSRSFVIEEPLSLDQATIHLPRKNLSEITSSSPTTSQAGSKYDFSRFIRLAVLSSAVKINHALFTFTDKTQNPPFTIKDIEFHGRFDLSDKSLFQFPGTFKWADTIFKLDSGYDAHTHLLKVQVEDEDKQIRFASEILTSNPSLPFRGKLEFHNLPLQEWFPQKNKELPWLTGFINASFQLQGEGTSPSIWWKKLTGKGTFEIQKGAVKRINFIREIFTNLLPIPGFSVLTQPSDLPPLLEQTLKNPDTPFNLLQGRLMIQNEQLRLEATRLTGDGYEIEAEGKIDLAKEAPALASQLNFLQKWQEVLTGQLREMQALEEDDKLMLPFLYQGIWPGVSAEPDLNYIARRLIQRQGEQIDAKGNEKLNDYLEFKK